MSGAKSLSEAARAGWPGNWRAMRESDLDAVVAIAGQVHPGFPEDRTVFADRLDLAPEFCAVLQTGGPPRAPVLGYLIAHPWGRLAPPALNTMLRRLPDPAPSLCLHDLALLPETRGRGAGQAGVRAVLERAAAAGLQAAVLAAVNGSVPFWTAQGFVAVAGAALSPDYGADARVMRCRLMTACASVARR